MVRPVLYFPKREKSRLAEKRKWEAGFATALSGQPGMSEKNLGSSIAAGGTLDHPRRAGAGRLVP